MIEELLQRYQEQRVRLDEVGSDDEDGRDDAMEVGSREAAPFGLMSQTSTHYQFDSPAPQGLPLRHGEVVNDEDGVDSVLGFGRGAELNEQEVFRTLTASILDRSDPTGQPSAESQPPLDGEEPITPAAVPVSIESPVIPASPPRKKVTLPPVQVSEQRGEQGQPTITRMTTVCATTTVTTMTTRTTPVSSVASPTILRQPGSAPNVRRRSSSEGEKDGARPALSENKEKVFRTKQLVATRSQILSQDLDEIVSRIHDAERNAAGWVSEELRLIQRRLNELEELESTIWARLEKLEGKASQQARIGRWRDWLTRQTEKVRKIKHWTWEAATREAPPRRESHATECVRSVGHVEKVKLPTFSGRQDEFSEFRSQFRELCRGERYTPVLEMAQLRLKLPKDALATIAGLQCPELAWKRLEEQYGNRELSILSALKNLRELSPASRHRTKS